MTPQNWMRRAALIEQAITDTALDYRFGDTYAKRGKKDVPSSLNRSRPKSLRRVGNTPSIYGIQRRTSLTESVTGGDYLELFEPVP